VSYSKLKYRDFGEIRAAALACLQRSLATYVNGKPTPIDSILRLGAFRFKIRFTSNAEGVIDWVGDTLLYGSIQFSMPQLRSMIHGMIASAQQHILANLMLLQMDSEGSVARDTTACPTIDWGKLVDNAAEQQVGWSFMEDPRNKNATSVEEPKQWLAQRLQNEKAIRSQFIDVEATRAALARGGGVVWAESRIQAYGQAMKGARQELAPLVHMTGGGPPRGSELENKIAWRLPRYPRPLEGCSVNGPTLANRTTRKPRIRMFRPNCDEHDLSSSSTNGTIIDYIARYWLCM
jgi:hypothetical protein